MENSKIIMFRKVILEELGNQIEVIETIDEDFRLWRVFQDLDKVRITIDLQKRYECITKLRQDIVLFNCRQSQPINWIVPYDFFENKQNREYISFYNLDKLINELSRHAVQFDKCVISFTDTTPINQNAFSWGYSDVADICPSNDEDREMIKSHMKIIEDHDFIDERMIICHKELALALSD